MQNASRKCSKKHTQDWQWNQKVSETQHPGQNSMIDVENPDARKKKNSPLHATKEGLYTTQKALYDDKVTFKNHEEDSKNPQEFNGPDVILRTPNR